MYETFEHTADVGIRVHGPDLDSVFAAAAEGLFSLMVTERPTDRGTRRSFSIAGDRPDLLLLDWLNELVYTFDSERVVFGGFSCHLGDRGLEANAAMESFDPTRHHPRREVKAITYHGLRIDQAEDGSWVAEFIVDV